MYECVILDLKPGHLRRLADGSTIQCQHQMIGKGIKIVVHKTTARKIHSAHRGGRGVRFAMSPHEIMMSEKMMGGKVTWKQFKRGLKKGWDFYKKNVRSAVSPLLKKGVKALASFGASYLGQPELAGVAENLGDMILDKTGITSSGDSGSQTAQAPASSVDDTPAAYVPPPIPGKQTAPGEPAGWAGQGVRRRRKSTAVKKTTKKTMTMGKTKGHGLYAGRGLYAAGSLPTSTGMTFQDGRAPLARSMSRSNIGTFIHAGPAPFMNPSTAPVINVGNMEYGDRYIR